MVCIWEARLDRVWAVAQLLRIVENMKFWAMRILRPRLAGYIDQWRTRKLAHDHLPAVPEPEVVENRQISKLVRRIIQQSRIHGLPSPSIPEISQLAITMTEVLAAARVERTERETAT
jgi:hypothetical protein